MSFKRFRDVRVQLLSSTAQEAGMRHLLQQRVLEGIDRLGGRADADHQLGIDEPAERGSQLVLGKKGDGTQ
jgi:hypothetical protein